MAAHQKPSRFFKVIVEFVLESKKLSLPPNFVRAFGDELSDTATFEIRNGRDWEIKIKKDGDKIWFEDGWDDFVDYYSIGIGSFLVFGYQDNSIFNVLIFDKSMCEIQYPEYCRERFNRVKIEKNSEDEMEVDNPVEKNSKSSDQNQPPRFRDRPGKMAHAKESKNKAVDDMDESDDEEDGPLSEGREQSKFFEILENKGICMSSTKLEAVERGRAISAALLFSPENPPFMVFCRSYSLSKCFLRVPTVFVKKHLSTNIGMTKLCSNGNEWNALLRPSGTSCVIGQGWNCFARDNSLQEGDICVFELIKTKEVVLRVSISRVRA